MLSNVSNEREMDNKFATVSRSTYLLGLMEAKVRSMRYALTRRSFKEAERAYCRLCKRLHRRKLYCGEEIKFNQIERLYLKAVDDGFKRFEMDGEKPVQEINCGPAHEGKMNINHALGVASTFSYKASVMNTECAQSIASFKSDIIEANAHSAEIASAYETAKANIAARGMKYARNTIASRRGFMAEEVVNESLIADAVTKKIRVHAVCPDSNKIGSVDVQVTGENGCHLEASCKFYSTPEKSANAQSAPSLDGQVKIIPCDQLNPAVEYSNRRAERELKRGRPEAAERHRRNGETLTDKISFDGAESTPLMKRQANDLAKAITVDEDGRPKADMEKIDQVMVEIGVKEKCEKKISENNENNRENHIKINETKRKRIVGEIKGAATAAGVSAVTAGAVSTVETLITEGVSKETLKKAAVAGAKNAAEGGAVGLITYGAARTVGCRLANQAASALGNAGISMSQNITAGVGIGVVGSVATVAASAYNFVKLKSQGVSTKAALRETGKNAAVSVGISVSTGLVTAAFGVTAGVAASALIGIGMVGLSIFNAFKKKKNEKKKKRSFFDKVFCFA
jgi:hypothetical protein